MFANFNFQQMVSAFIVLFAVIDIIGSIPIIINLLLLQAHLSFS